MLFYDAIRYWIQAIILIISTYIFDYFSEYIYICVYILSKLNIKTVNILNSIEICGCLRYFWFRTMPRVLNI